MKYPLFLPEIIVCRPTHLFPGDEFLTVDILPQMVYVRSGIEVLECYAPQLFAQCHRLIVNMQHSSRQILFLDTHCTIVQVRSAANLLLATGLHPVDQAVAINL